MGEPLNTDCALAIQPRHDEIYYSNGRVLTMGHASCGLCAALLQVEWCTRYASIVLQSYSSANRKRAPKHQPRGPSPVLLEDNLLPLVCVRVCDGYVCAYVYAGVFILVHVCAFVLGLMMRLAIPTDGCVVSTCVVSSTTGSLTCVAVTFIVPTCGRAYLRDSKQACEYSGATAVGVCARGSRSSYSKPKHSFLQAALNGTHCRIS